MNARVIPQNVIDAKTCGHHQASIIMRSNMSKVSILWVVLRKSADDLYSVELYDRQFRNYILGSHQNACLLDIGFILLMVLDVLFK